MLSSRSSEIEGTGNTRKCWERRCDISTTTVHMPGKLLGLWLGSGSLDLPCTVALGRGVVMA